MKKQKAGDGEGGEEGEEPAEGEEAPAKEDEPADDEEPEELSPKSLAARVDALVESITY